MIEGLEKITDSYLLSEKNAKFFLSSTGLLMVQVKEKDFEGRAFVSLAFPFEMKEEYICILTYSSSHLCCLSRKRVLWT